MNRFLISAAHRSSGKTVVSAGLAAALTRRGRIFQHVAGDQRFLRGQQDGDMTLLVDCEFVRLDLLIAEPKIEPAIKGDGWWRHLDRRMAVTVAGFQAGAVAQHQLACPTMTVDRAVSEDMSAAYVIAMPVGVDDREAADAKLPFKVLAQPFGLARHSHGINHDGLTAVVDDVATTAKAHIHIGVRRVATPIEVDHRLSLIRIGSIIAASPYHRQ